jgi:hypothetical protein
MATVRPRAYTRRSQVSTAKNPIGSWKRGRPGPAKPARRGTPKNRNRAQQPRGNPTVTGTLPPAEGRVKRNLPGFEGGEDQTRQTGPSAPAIRAPDQEWGKASTRLYPLHLAAPLRGPRPAGLGLARTSVGFRPNSGGLELMNSGRVYRMGDEGIFIILWTSPTGHITSEDHASRLGAGRMHHFQS